MSRHEQLITQSQPERKKTPDQVREGLYTRIVGGRIGEVLKASGLVLSLSAAPGCKFFLQDPYAYDSRGDGRYTPPSEFVAPPDVSVPKREALDEQRMVRPGPGPEYVEARQTTLEQERAFLRQTFGDIAPIPEEEVLDPEERAFHERRATEPADIYNADRAGYHSNTLQVFLLTGCPHFMGSWNEIRYMTFTGYRDFITHYGSNLAASRVAGRAHAYANSFLRGYVEITREAFAGETPQTQTRSFTRVLLHELAHRVDPWNRMRGSREERTHEAYDVASLATGPLAVRFHESSNITNPDPHLQNFHRTTEYHAEAIEGALSTRVAAGESWRANYMNQLILQYGASPEGARRTANYAIGFIMAHDPTYDQVSGYDARERLGEILAQQRTENAESMRVALNHADKLIAVERQRADLHQRVSRYLYDHESTFRQFFHGEQGRDAVLALGYDQSVEYFIFENDHPRDLPAMRHIPPVFMRGPRRELIDLWIGYINTIRQTCLARLRREANDPPSQAEQDAQLDESLAFARFLNAVHSAHLTPGMRQSLEAWAFRYARERAASHILFPDRRPQRR